MRRPPTAVVVGLVVLLLGVPMIGRFAQALTDSMLFHPERGHRAGPADFGIAYDEVWLVAEDGVRTQAWWMPVEGASTAVVSFHGNAGTMGDRLQHLSLLRSRGVSVLAAEYRGYGDSEGAPSEEGLAADARAAAAWIRERHAGALVAHGRSLGGAVGIRLADDVGVDGLIVESTFTSLGAMAERTGIPLAARLVVYEFASHERIRRIAAPTLVVHGDADDLIPVSMGRALTDAAPDAHLHVVAGGTHNDTWVRGGQAYWAAVEGLLARVQP
jgi:fermentation-respiration switch protein FrsA (DUF1100 family)